MRNETLFNSQDSGAESEDSYEYHPLSNIACMED